MQKRRTYLLFLFLVTAFLFSGCRPFWEIIGMAESQYFFETKNKAYCISLYPSNDSGFQILVYRIDSPRLHWNKNPKYYEGYVTVESPSIDTEEFIISQCENRISYKQIYEHRNILYLFNPKRMDYWNKIPQDITNPTYATLDDTIGYREYASIDLIPSKFRIIGKYGRGGVELIYYDIPNEINELKYYIKLEIMHSGRLFSADTTLDLSKSYYEYPLFVH